MQFQSGLFREAAINLTAEIPLASLFWAAAVVALFTIAGVIHFTVSRHLAGKMVPVKVRKRLP